MKEFIRLTVSLLTALLMMILAACATKPAAVKILVDPAHTSGTIDIGRYSLGQGGLSREPMFDVHLEDVAALRPRTIRLFVQEYFELLPEPGRYHWDTLDRSIETILATGAKPILSLCFKPPVLYPQRDQDIVHPNDYAEWEKLLEALVQHCNQEKNYGIEYWEIGNEVDIGETGGCPYRFQPADYNVYYQHSVQAILRADSTVKVGGPALANYSNAIGDSLIAFCGRGEAPLDFFSWHSYSNDPEQLRKTIREIKGKLAMYPSLAGAETIIDEWNIKLLGDEVIPGFQTAFVLEGTLAFLEEGLSLSSYYHIRDHFVAPEDFTWMTDEGYKFMSDWWNFQVQNSGLFDKQGRRRPAYYVFQLMSHIRGQRLLPAGLTDDIHAMAAATDSTLEMALWNFAPPDSGQTRDVELGFPAGLAGSFELLHVNVPGNTLDTVRSGELAELAGKPLAIQLAPYGVYWLRVRGI